MPGPPYHDEPAVIATREIQVSKEHMVSLSFTLELKSNYMEILIWRRHHNRLRASDFDLHVYSALISIEQPWFLNVSHLL